MVEEQLKLIRFIIYTLEEITVLSSCSVTKSLAWMIPTDNISFYAYILKNNYLCD